MRSFHDTIVATGSAPVVSIDIGDLSAVHAPAGSCTISFFKPASGGSGGLAVPEECEVLDPENLDTILPPKTSIGLGEWLRCCWNTLVHF